MTVDVFLALGANLGDRLASLRAACAALEAELGPLHRSPVYETPPWGYTDQPPFLNMVVQGRSALPPLALLDYLKALERDLGRQPSFRYGPRQIDLDILFYDGQVFQHERLVIPHPRLHERAFVLVPLADLAPDLVHPVLGVTVRALLSAVETVGIVRLADDI